MSEPVKVHYVSEEEKLREMRSKAIKPPRTRYKGITDGVGINVLFLVLLGLLATAINHVARLQGW